MRRNAIKRSINTTLGDLIETLSEVAFEDCKDAKEAYALAGFILTDLLSNCLCSDVTPIPIKDSATRIGLQPRCHGVSCAMISPLN